MSVRVERAEGLRPEGRERVRVQGADGGAELVWPWDVYDEEDPDQAAFLNTIRTVVAPGDWKHGPHRLAVAEGILTVRTTPEYQASIARWYEENGFNEPEPTANAR